MFQKSFSILDDVAVICSSVLADCGVKDRQTPRTCTCMSVSLPNYEPKMRIGGVSARDTDKVENNKKNLKEDSQERGW